MNITWISAFGFYFIMLTSAVWAAPVPDSGQTKCYNNIAEITCPSPGQPFYGQDANRALHPMSYTKLDESGKALPDSATKWVMVRDNVTGLIWEMKNSMDENKDYDNPHDADNTYYWYDGRMDSHSEGVEDTLDTDSVIKSLNSTRFGGYCDWRLPTIKELGSIVNFNISHPGPTIDSIYFPDTQSSFYWSATPYPYFTSFVWGVYFNHGHDDFYSNYYEFYARAVRGGASDTDYDPYIDNNNGTVTDTDTGMMWQQETPENLLTWEQALSYCENLTLAGFSDWRLPSIKELRSLTDYYRYKPSINTTVFPNTRQSFYWAATTFTGILGNAWGAYYNYGYDHYDVSKSTPSFVRAVRSLGNTIPTSNSIGPRNIIRFSDFSGALPDSGRDVCVRGWDAEGNSLSEKSDVQPLKLFNHGTISLSGSDLAARFQSKEPMLYQFSVDSSDVVITNEKNAASGSFDVPNVYFNNASHLASNSIDNFSTVKMTDMSGLVNNCSIINVSAWNADGVSIPESISAAPLFLFNHGTTEISGDVLAARFPSGTPQTYQFEIPSTKVLFTTEKHSDDGAWSFPASITRGVSNFVSNTIRSNSTLVISDLSGKIVSGGAAITIMAWDAIGIPISESESSPPLILGSHGTLQVTGVDLAARFPSGTPANYEFSNASSRLLITHIKASPDLLTEIPAFFTKGMSSFAANHISYLSTIKISDTSGGLPAGGAPITITAWDVNGRLVPESTAAAPLLLYNYGTTTMGGLDILNRFTSGNPVLYEFSVSSSSAIVTHVTSSADGAVKVPNVFSVGIPGGI